MSIEKTTKHAAKIEPTETIGSIFPNIARFVKSTTHASVLALGLMLPAAAHAEEAKDTTAVHAGINADTDEEAEHLSSEFDKYVQVESDSDIPFIDKELFLKDYGVNLDDEESIRNAFNLSNAEYKEFKTDVLKAGISWQFILITAIVLFFLGQPWFRGMLSSIRNGTVNSYNYLNGLRTRINASPRRNAIYGLIFVVFSTAAGYYYFSDSEEENSQAPYITTPIINPPSSSPTPPTISSEPNPSSISSSEHPTPTPSDDSEPTAPPGNPDYQYDWE